MNSIQQQKQLVLTRLHEEICGDLSVQLYTRTKLFFMLGRKVIDTDLTELFIIFLVIIPPFILSHHEYELSIKWKILLKQFIL